MVVCVIALRRGGRYERLAAGMMLAAWALTMVVYRSGFHQTEWGILAVDVAALGVFVWIALQSDRYWPIFAAGFHLLAIVTHLARTVDPSVGGYAYITAEILWGYLLAAVIGYGAWSAGGDQVETSAAPAATRR
jgi:hypothetical protein